MDLGDITQLALVAAVVAVLSRVGWALARMIERRSSGDTSLPTEAAERLRVLEEEQLSLHQQLAELQDRQDFTERVLLRDARPPVAPSLPAAPSDRQVTPH